MIFPGCCWDGTSSSVPCRPASVRSVPPARSVPSGSAIRAAQMLSRPNRVRYQGAPPPANASRGSRYAPSAARRGRPGRPRPSGPAAGRRPGRRRRRDAAGGRPDDPAGVGDLDLPRELQHGSRPIVAVQDTAAPCPPGPSSAPGARTAVATRSATPDRAAVDEPRGDRGARVTLLHHVHRDVVGREGELHPYRHGSRGRGASRNRSCTRPGATRREPVQPHRRVRAGVAQTAQQTGEAGGVRAGACVRDRLGLLAVHRQHRGRQGAHVGVQDALGAGAPQLAVGARGDHGGSAQDEHEVVQRRLEGAGRCRVARTSVLIALLRLGRLGRPHLDRSGSGGQASTT